MKRTPEELRALVAEALAKLQPDQIGEILLGPRSNEVTAYTAGEDRQAIVLTVTERGW